MNQAKKKKSNFDIDKTFKALKMIAWLFSTLHVEKRLNAGYTCLSDRIKSFSN